VRSVNLVPPELVMARRRADRTRVWAGITVVYSVIALSTGALAWSAGRVGVDTRDRLAELNDLTQKREVALRAAREALGVATRKVAAAREVSVHPNWTLLLEALATLKGPDVVLATLKIEPIMPKAEPTARAAGRAAEPVTKPTSGAGSTNPAGYSMLISGDARTQQAVTDFVLRLEGTRIFASVRLIESRSKPGPSDGGKPPVGEIIGFSLECRLTESAGGAR
jgi:hypothetical protein